MEICKKPKTRRINIKKYMLIVFVFSLSFTNAFALNEDINMPLLLGILCLILNYQKMKFNDEDLFFLIFILLLILSTLLNEPKTISSISYIIGFLISFFAYNRVIYINYVKYKKIILKTIYISTIVLCIYICYEFITRNFFPSLFISLPRPFMENMMATFSSRYFRARGFAEEPGHTSLFLEFSIPICLYYLKVNNKKVMFFIILLIPVLFFINSAAFILISFLSIVLLCLHYWKKFKLKGKKVKKYKILIFFVLLLISILIILFLPYELFLNNLIQSLNELFSKAFIISESSSYIDRNARFIYSIDILKQHMIFGVGPMNLDKYIKYETSLIMIFDIILFSGIFGVIMFATYLILIFVKLMKIGSDIKIYLFASFIMVLLHYQIITNFWYPPLWVISAFIQGEYRLNNKMHSNQEIIALFPIKK